jgi:hypothetical protein
VIPVARKVWQQVDSGSPTSSALNFSSSARQPDATVLGLAGVAGPPVHRAKLGRQPAKVDFSGNAIQAWGAGGKLLEAE